MTEEQIRQIVIEEIGNVAPDTDPGAIDPGSDIREALDLDSMDVLNIIIALHTRLGIDIPEADYPRLLSIAGAARYIAGKLAP